MFFKELIKPIDSPEKIIGDVASVLTLTGVMATMLPTIAALFTVVWTGIRIYETATVQSLLGRKKPYEPDEEA